MTEQKLLSAYEHLIEEMEQRDDITSEDTLHLRMSFHHVSLSILRRTMHAPEWKALHEKQLQMTENPQSKLEAQYHVLATSYSLDRVDGRLRI